MNDKTSKNSKNKERKVPAFENMACPVCKSVGTYVTDDKLEIFCEKCGLVIISPYPYCAGVKFKVLSDF